MSSGKKTRGRQKIEMKKITNESSMLVTFTKRRCGLFKKASELSTLCGADVALIIFSPSEKAFSFGHPNVDTVIDRYLSLVPSQNNGDMRLIEAQHSANVCELNSQLTWFKIAQDIERRRSVELSHMHNLNETQCWRDRLVDGMNFDQLESLKNVLEDLRKHIVEHPARLVIQGAPTQTVPFCVGDGSCSNMYVHNQPNHQQGPMFPAQPFQDPMLQPYLFDCNNMEGGGGYQPFENGSSSNMHAHHQQGQMFPAQLFQDPMLQPYLFDYSWEEEKDMEPSDSHDLRA